MTDKKKDVYALLHDVQTQLKAPKNQRNNFGKYNYRSCEDILEGVKSVMPEGCYVTLSDELVMIGDRYYIKATASFSTGGDYCIDVTGYAREAKDKKGMDESQITGAASSYARKYALNGLFAIDDTKDADSQDNTAKPAQKQKPVVKKSTPEEKAAAKKKILQRAQQGMIKELKDCVNHDELQNLWTGYADDLAEIKEFSKPGYQAVVDTYEEKDASFKG